MEQQENILLTDEQVIDKAKENADRFYNSEDISLRIMTSHANQHESALRRYKEGWNECTEYYRELIGAGTKWKELVTHCEGLSTLWYGKKRTGEETIDLMTSVINKVTELQDRK